MKRRPAVLIAEVTVLLLIAITAVVILRGYTGNIRGARDVSWNLSVLGGALELYSQAHGGSLPSSIDELVQNNILERGRARQIAEQTIYLGSGKLKKSLPNNAVVAIQADAPSNGSMSVLLASGAVVAARVDHQVDLRHLREPTVVETHSDGSIWITRDTGGR